MQRVVVITPPTAIVDLADVKSHLRVDHNDDDALIDTMLAAATGYIDGPNGYLGRAIGEQTLEAGLDGFVYDPITLPCPPVINVDAIGYQDVTGAWRTLDPAKYEVRDDCVGTAWGTSWPGTRAYRGPNRTVRIRYRAGYQDVPPAIRVAVLMMVGDLYKFRDSAPEPSAAVASLLQPFRVYT